MREEAMEELGKEWATKDPGAALEHAHMPLTGGERRELVASVMKHWSEQDLESAIVYA